MGWKQPVDTDLLREFGEDYIARNLFILLLLRARNEDMTHVEHYQGKPYKLKKGQAIFGRNQYAREQGVSPSSIYKALKRLELGHGKVTSNPSPDYTVITILNYDELVGLEQAKKQAGNKQVTSREQAGNTNKLVKSVKSVKKKDSAAKKAATPESLSDFITKQKASSQKHVRLIGWFAEQIKPEFKTSEQWDEFRKRHLRAAVRLAKFERDMIIQAHRAVLESNYCQDYTLDTILKFLTNGHKPKTITLREKVEKGLL